MNISLPYGKGPCLTFEAEKALIYPLLSEKLFLDVGDVTIRRLLAAYPNAPEQSKSNIILDFMGEAWKRKDFFEVFSAFDVFLEVSGKRGHFTHQFEVFLLGANIFLLLRDSGVNVEEVCDFKNIQEVMYTWMMASSTHDFGYPIEESSKIIKRLANLYESFGLDSVKDKYLSLDIGNILEGDKEFPRLNLGEENGIIDKNINISRMVRKTIEESSNMSEGEVVFLQKKLVGNDVHGYASSILLCQNILKKLLAEKSFSEIEQDWIYKALLKAMGGIALHGLGPKDRLEENSPPLITKLNFSKNPFCYLLFLVDNIQDYNRSNFPNENYPEYFLKEFESSATDKRFRLVYSVRHENWSDDVKEKAKNFIDEKRVIFDLLPEPTPLCGVEIIVKYELSYGKFEEFSVRL